MTGYLQATHNNINVTLGWRLGVTCVKYTLALGAAAPFEPRHEQNGAGTALIERQHT